MNRARKIMIATFALVLVAVVILFFAAPSIQRSFFYPKPRVLPPCVEATMEDLLPKLQQALEKNAPFLVQSLQRGLSDAEITDLEKKAGFHLSNELRALYRWHNGMNVTNIFGLTPAEQFLPLEKVVDNYQYLHQPSSSATGIQKAASAVLTSHMKSWIHVFDDGAGDGYFYDPQRSDAEGAFFYHMNETGQYVWFPCLRNFISGVIECYETGVVTTARDGKGPQEDYVRSQKIWERFGKDSEFEK